MSVGCAPSYNSLDVISLSYETHKKSDSYQQLPALSLNFFPSSQWTKRCRRHRSYGGPAFLLVDESGHVAEEEGADGDVGDEDVVVHAETDVDCPWKAVGRTRPHILAPIVAAMLTGLDILILYSENI
nr:hypothetical protein Iba_chr12bCG23250 [Ipomoea batatas]